MRRLILFFIMVMSVLGLWADNVLSVSTSDGTAEEVISVKVSLALSSDVSAAEIAIPLDKQLAYVEGSCTFNNDRLVDHTTSVYLDKDTIKIYIYSLSLSQIKKGEGELLTFKLKCGNEPGHYAITPSMILSDVRGEPKSSSIIPAYLTIRTGKVVTPGKIAFPQAMVGKENSTVLTIKNTGNKTVNVSNILSSCDWMRVSSTKFSIASGASQDIVVTVTPEKKGKMQESLTIISDAGNKEVLCPVIINAFRENTISFSSENSSQGGKPIVVDVFLDNQEQVTAIEFTLELPAGAQVVPNSIETTERTEGFSKYFTNKDNKYTVTLFSLTNKAIKGTDGKVLSFEISPSIRSGSYKVKVEGIKVLNTAAENVASQTEYNFELHITNPQLSLWPWENFSTEYVPAGETQDDKLQILNEGQADLIITDIQFGDSGCSTDEEFPITISPNAAYKVRVMVNSRKVGDFISSVTILSNDPVTPCYETYISTKIIELNTLTLSGDFSEDNRTFHMNVGMNNTEGISAVQMDLHCPDYVITDASKIVLSGRVSATHKISISPVSRSTYRVLLYSTDNTCISGDEGNLFSIDFENPNEINLQCKDFRIDNVLMGNKQGQNCCSIETYGFYTLSYYKYTNPLKTGISTLESITVGTGTRLDSRDEWVGEPVIMGTKSVGAYCWKTIKYKLIYMVDGEVYNEQEIEPGAKITSIAAPAKKGYSFSGWSNIPAKMPIRDVIITGTFTVNKYKLIYMLDGQKYSETDVEYGATIVPLSGPTKEDKVFSRWSGIPATMPDHDVIIYGEFYEKSYLLTYIVDGVIYHQETVDYGAVITPMVPPTKEGKIFSGWSEIPATMPAHDVTVFGTFHNQSYLLTYIVDGAIYHQEYVEYGASITPLESPTQAGKKFSGWEDVPATMPDHDVTISGYFQTLSYLLTYYVDGVIYHQESVEYGAVITPLEPPTEEGKTFSGWSEIPATMPAHDVTVFGIFHNQSYLLTYIVDGVVYHQEYVEYGAAITPLEPPTQAGKKFSGWEDVPATMPDHDVTISGYFQTLSYLLTYYVDGVIYHQESVEYGAAITPIKAPTKEGYYFSGWSSVPATMPDHDLNISGRFILKENTQPAPSSCFNYRITSTNTVTISSCNMTQINNAKIEDLVIPNTIEYSGRQYIVTGLGADCFNNAEFTSVTIPASVIDLPHVYGSRSSHIGDMKQCEAYFVAEDNPYFCSIDGVLFTKDGKELIKYPASKKDIDYVVPETVEYVCNQAFRSIQYLQNLQLSALIKCIGTYAFDAVISLKTVKLPAQEVPEEDGITSFSGTRKVSLYVCAYLLNEYKGKKPWTSFKEIIGYYPEGVITEINEIGVQEETDSSLAPIYDLNGRRATRGNGLIIKNGKKYWIK